MVDVRRGRLEERSGFGPGDLVTRIIGGPGGDDPSSVRGGGAVADRDPGSGTLGDRGSVRRSRSTTCAKDSHNIYKNSIAFPNLINIRAVLRLTAGAPGDSFNAPESRLQKRCKRHHSNLAQWKNTRKSAARPATSTDFILSFAICVSDFAYF